VQVWDRALQQQDVAPTYRRVLFANLSAILSAAVNDERIAKNPCRAASVRAPRLVTRKVTPWPTEQVLDVHAALPARYRVAATIAAGCGLRQGEVFGLAVDDVEFLGRTLHVVRQVKIVRSRLVLALPKGRKTRDIPLPATVANELARHIGHSDPGFTLRTYTHLLPNSEQRTRQAVDRALAGGASTVDGLTTAQEPN
jgi:integrase